MFIHNINPILFSIGPIEIRYYGLVYVLGFVAGYYALKKILGYSTKEADSLTIWLIMGMLVGARTFFFLFYRPDLFTPIQFISLWDGGMSFHGALIGMLGTAYIWTKKYKKNLWELADTGALVTPIFLFLGRITNFINAEIVGTQTSVAWCVEFPREEGCRHPVQLYAAAKNVFLGVLTYLAWKKKNYEPGFIFWIFAFLYSILRFTVNFWREDQAILFGWMKMGHLLTLALFIISTYILLTKYREDSNNLIKKNNKEKKE